MKIKLIKARPLVGKRILLTIMRTFIFLLCTTVFSLSPTNSFSQKKIEIKTDRVVSVNEVFNIIEQQTDYRFIYPQDLFTNAPKIQLRKGKIKIANLLKTCLLGSKLDFKLSDKNTIEIVEHKKTKQIPSQIELQEFTVNGAVSDSNGQPLPGANVLEKGTTNGTQTDFDGNFTLNVTDNAEIIIISYIGFKTKEITIGDKINFTIQLEEETNTLNEVVVTGFRKSLEEAIDIKKNSVNAVDAIVAEDIAKFPQSNLAEAVQRISGIQIRRDNAGGVGSSISIRGLSSEYTQVTVDGDAAPNSGNGRSYDFGSLPAEIFNKVEVTKTPTAKTIEGGIGGSVNLVTKKPFELKKKIMVASVEGVYNTQNQVGARATPKLSFTYGNKWNNKFGVIAGAFYNKFYNTSEGYDVVRYYDESYDLDNNGTNEFEGIQVPLPRFISQGQVVERLSLNLSMQYQVTDKFNLIFEGLFVNNDQTASRYSTLWFLPGDANPTNLITDGPFVQSITYDDINETLENQQQTNITKNYKWSLKGKWKLGKGWKLGSKFIHAYNKRDSERFRYYANNTSTVTYSVLDDLQFFDLQTPTNFSDSDQFRMNQSRRYLWDFGDEILTAKFDFSKKINNKFNIEFGTNFRDRTKIQQYFFRRDNTLNDPFTPVASLLTGFLDNVDRAKGFNEFVVHDFDKSYELYGSKLDLTDFKVISNSYDINEQIAASYIQGNYKLKRLDLNFGARLINTNITSRAFDLDNQTQVFKVREIKSNYSDLLPSINAKWEFSRGLIARAGFARVMTRPRLQDLSAYRLIDDVNKRITANNPELDPFRANQYDISFEWYPKPEILISGAFFVKDIESFISRQTVLIPFNGDEYELRQPVNGNNAVIRGFEFNYQQPFDFLPSPFDGLGVVANYTFSESDFEEELEDGSIGTYPLPNNSKHSFNLTGYYEKYGFSIRVAHNFRSSFLREIPNLEDGLKFRDDVGITDISSSYDINDNFGITLNIQNAFNAKRYEYIMEERFQDNVSFFGTTFQLGLRAKF